jgi:hypothetical protein
MEAGKRGSGEAWKHGSGEAGTSPKGTYVNSPGFQPRVKGDNIPLSPVRDDSLEDRNC